MIFRIILYGLMLVSLSLSGQNTFDANSFLSWATQEEAVEFQREKMRYLSTLPHRISRIDKLEVRTETSDFDFSKQEYLLRISPNSLKNVNTHRQYHQTIQYRTEMELEETLRRALKERYDLLVNFIYLQELLTVKNKLFVLYKDKVTLLNRSITLPGFNVLDLIEAQDEKQSNVRDILDLENGILTTRQTIQRLKNTDKTIAIDPQKRVTIEKVKQVLGEIKASAVDAHPLLKVQSAKLYNNMLEYEWEFAKSSFSIGYIQAKYGYNPNDNFKESFSIGIGFEIPIKGAAQLNLNELLIKKLESESNYRSTKSQLDNKKFVLFQQLQSRIKKYELVKEQLEEGQAEFVIQEYSKIAEASPTAMLKLRENTLKNELLLKQLEWDIVQSYIAYLDLVGLLSRQPLKNYLSKGLTEF